MEIFITRKTFTRIVSYRTGVVNWGLPTLDVFAGPWQPQHRANSLYTSFCSPGSASIGAMHGDWAKHATMTGRRSLLWVPPFHLIGAVINALQHEFVNAIFIVPVFLRY